MYDLFFAPATLSSISPASDRVVAKPVAVPPQFGSRPLARILSGTDVAWKKAQRRYAE
jgi:hypothetical protein